MANVVLFGILWIVISLLGEWGVSFWINSAPNGAGPYFGTASNLGVISVSAFDFIVWVAVPIFVFIVLMLVFSMIKFSVRKNSQEKGDAKVQTRATLAASCADQDGRVWDCCSLLKQHVVPITSTPFP